MKPANDIVEEIKERIDKLAESLKEMREDKHAGSTAYTYELGGYDELKYLLEWILENDAA